jgi:site-specific DNA-cytosine methylase
MTAQTPAIECRSMTVADAIAAGAPRNLAKLSAVVVGRGWGVRVERPESVDAWVLVTLHPHTGAETGRWGWSGTRWIAGQRYGFKALCDYYASEAEAEAPDAPARVCAQPIISSATGEATGRMCGGALSANGGPLTCSRCGLITQDVDAEAEAEAYRAVMAECAEHTGAIAAMGSVERLEREDVPHTNATAREAAIQGERDARALMTRAAQAQGVEGGAESVRREVLPLLRLAREAVAAYDAHRAEETREYRARMATKCDACSDGSCVDCKAEAAARAAAERYRVKATKAQDRVSKGLPRVKAAEERGNAALKRAEAARGRAEAAAGAERERLDAATAYADSVVWSLPFGSRERLDASFAWADARDAAERGDAQAWADECAEHVDTAEACAGEGWADDDRKGFSDAAEAAEYARKETVIEYGAFERDDNPSEGDAEHACHVICEHSRDMARLIREAEAAANGAEAAAKQAEAAADAAEAAASDGIQDGAHLFALPVPDARQVELSRSHYGVTDTVAEAWRADVVTYGQTPVPAPVKGPADAPAESGEPEAAAERAERRAAGDAVRAAFAKAWPTGAEGSPVRLVNRRGDAVDVQFTGRGVQCWSHCADECPAQTTEAEACTCPVLPVILIDGPNEPYPWEECAHCAAGVLRLDASDTLSAARRSADGVADVVAPVALADAMMTDAVAAESGAAHLRSLADDEERAQGGDASCVVAWRAQAAETMALGVALAQWADHIRNHGLPAPVAPKVAEAPAEPVAESGPYGLPLVPRAVRIAEAEARAVAAEATRDVLHDLSGLAWDVVDTCPAQEHAEAERRAEAATARWFRADRRAWSARYEADRLTREDAETREMLARTREFSARLLAEDYAPQGRRVFRSADGRSALVLAVPEEYPSPEAKEHTEEFAAVMASAIAAKDAGKTIAGRGYPDATKAGKRGPVGVGAAIREGEIFGKAWTAPKGTRKLTDKALAAWDESGDVIAETEAAPGVWLPALAVRIADTAAGNGWTVAMERRSLYDGRAVVVVRIAGVVPQTTRDGESVGVAGEGVAVWVDGRYCPLRSGRYSTRTGGRAAVGVDWFQAAAGRVVESWPVRTSGEPVPAVAADAGPSDPGGVESWESDGGAGAEGPAGAHGYIELPPPANCDDGREPAPAPVPVEPQDGAALRDALIAVHGNHDKMRALRWWCEDDCTTCADGRECADCPTCTAFAAPWPARWARYPQDGDPERMVHVCHGPGGMSEGQRLALGGDESAHVDAVGIEINEGAAATARAAGYTVIVADVRTIDPRHPVLSTVKRLHLSTPCPTISTGGKRSGVQPAEVERFMNLLFQASEWLGHLEVEDVCGQYGGPHEFDTQTGGDAMGEANWDADAYEGRWWWQCEEHYSVEGEDDSQCTDTCTRYIETEHCGTGLTLPSCTPEEFRALAMEACADERTALMAEIVLWPMVLLRGGDSLESVTMEQSDNLLKAAAPICSAIQTELEESLQFGWVSFQIEDAATYGAASHRVRTWMVAMRHGQPDGATVYRRDDIRAYERSVWGSRDMDGVQRPDMHRRVDFLQGRAPLPALTVSQALGWESGLWVDTRGVRGVDPKTGRVKGGGSFSADVVAQCVTATWYGAVKRQAHEPQGCKTIAEHGRAFTQAELGVLVGFRWDYPWQHVGRGEGIRNKAQQAADAVSPFMGMAVTGAVMSRARRIWYRRALRYQRALYAYAVNLWTAEQRAIVDEHLQSEDVGARPVLGIEGFPRVALPPMLPAPPVRLMLERGPVPLMLEAAPALTVPQPDTGRAFWEPGQRVTLDGRPGVTRYSTIGRGVRVAWDDSPQGCDYADPRTLWAEGTEPAPRTPIAPPYRPAPRVITPPYTAPMPEASPVTTIDPERAARVLAILAEIKAEQAGQSKPCPIAAADEITPEPEPEPEPVAVRPVLDAGALADVDAMAADVDAVAAECARLLATLAEPEPVPVAPEPEPVADPLPVGDWNEPEPEPVNEGPTVGARVRTAAGWYGPALLALLLLVVCGAPVAGGVVSMVLAIVPRIPVWLHARRSRRSGGGRSRDDHGLAA